MAVVAAVVDVGVVAVVTVSAADEVAVVDVVGRETQGERCCTNAKLVQVP